MLGDKEVDLKKNKINTILVLLIVAALLVVGGFFVVKKWKPLSKQSNYTIPNVPYMGLYNHVGEYGYLGQKTSSAAAAMVLEYWNPGSNNFDEIRRSFAPVGQDRTIDGVGEVIAKLGDYSVQKKYLEISDLGQYINPNSRTPLLVFLPLSKDQPKDVIYYPANLLIGINDIERKLTLHSFWHGNNYELSYDEYNELLGAMLPDLRNYYLIVQPKNLEDSIGKIRERRVEAYPKRTNIMSDINMQKMISDYGIGLGAVLLSNDIQTIEYFSRVEKSTEFAEKMPPFLKLECYYYMATAYSNSGGLGNEKALEYTKRAIDINNDLDKPFSSDWPGFQSTMNRPSKYGVDSRPYELAGDIYFDQNMLNEAREFYNKALDIYPKRIEIKEKITLVEKKMAGE
ncbi:MAG: tetratricopeptide repeat protein [Candidatus Moraniibacteriota bacterium]